MIPVSHSPTPPAPTAITIVGDEPTLAERALPPDVADPIFDALGVAVSIFDRDGRLLTGSRQHRICRSFFHQAPSTRAICLVHNEALARCAMAQQQGQHQYLCPNGFMLGVAPIKLEDERVGSMIVGPLLLDPPAPALWRQRAAAHGWDEADFLAAAAEVPVVSAIRLDALVKLLLAYSRNLLVRCEAEHSARKTSEQARDDAVRERRLADETAALLHAMIDDLPGIVATKDGDGRYLLVNRTMAELFDLTPAAIVGATDAELLAEHTQTEYEQHSLALMASGQTEVIDEAIVDRRSGRVRYFRVTKRPFTTAEGWVRLLLIGQEITELQQAQAEVERVHGRFEFAMDMTGDGVWEWNVATDEVEHNAPWARILGLPEDVHHNPLVRFTERIHEDDAHILSAGIAGILAGDIGITGQYRIRRTDGRVIWGRSFGRVAERDAAGQPLRVVGRLSDVTAEHEANEAQRIAAVAFETQQGMVVTDSAARILRVNQAFTEITGFSAEEVIGHNPSMLRSGRHSPAFYCEMWAVLERTGRWQGEVWNRRKNGEIYPEWLNIASVRDEGNVVSHYVAAFSDITARLEAQNRISHLAFYDSLTELPNRRLLLDRLNHAIADHRRNGQHAALIFLDLDHFKTLNDTLGHDMGDRLLMLVAERLRGLMRESDTVARLGGDEFVVVLEHLGTTLEIATAVADRVAKKICAALAKSYRLNDHSHYSSASLGVCLFPAADSSAESLLKQADLALYKAKGAGRNQVRFYSAELQAAINQRARIEAGLRQALKQERFEFHFQPQVDGERRVVGAEALLRWRTASGELVMPGDFIAIAEDTGLIVPIGERAIDAACAQLARWAHQPHTAGLTLAINISACQTRQANFVEVVQAAIERYGVDPRRLKLELTESQAIAHIDRIVSKMRILRDVGVLFSLDDFGTGYSSLSALRKLLLEQIKIDQSFICSLDSNEEDAVIVRAIVAMSKSLQLEVLAEGVETEAQYQILRKLGCDVYQGYLFARPLPIEAFEAMLASR